MSQLLTKKEACEILRCSSRTFDRWRSLWRARGVDIGEVKIRKRALFRQERIEKLLSTPKLWLQHAE